MVLREPGVKNQVLREPGQGKGWSVEEGAFAHFSLTVVQCTMHTAASSKEKFQLNFSQQAAFIFYLMWISVAGVDFCQPEPKKCIFYRLWQWFAAKQRILAQSVFSRGGCEIKQTTIYLYWTS